MSESAHVAASEVVVFLQFLMALRLPPTTQPQRRKMSFKSSAPVIALAFVSVSVSAQNQSHAPLPQSDKYFKNVTALKGITVDDFMGAMGLYSAALSMCCGDCHVGAGTDNPDWASDENPRKRKARQMENVIQAINKEHFGGAKTITCWTCHRGSGQPSATATMDQIYGEPLAFPSEILKPAPKNSGVPSVDEIFDHYLKALGGAEKVNALTSYIGKGHSQPYGPVDHPDPSEIYAKAPDQLTMIAHQRGGDMIRTTDGKGAWVKLPLTVVKEYPLTGSLLEGGKLDGAMAFPGKIRQAFTSWRAGFPDSIDGKPVWAVQANGKSGLIATLYFDKQTGLLTRYVRHVNTADGRLPNQIDYSDYRPVAGVMMPFKFSYIWISGREEYTIDSYQPNVAIDSSKFAEAVLAAK
jgi:photosynthetic reaction center cytochrome c subunit